MREYEMMIILDPTNVDERNIKNNSEKWFKVIPDEGGTLEKIDVWGRRKLAYPIQKHEEGIYIVLEIKAKPATVQELDRQLALREDVLRTKLLRRDEK
ncbi:small subunit ribosomal protein S6 [Actinobaculum suis]|uniref:Small ribosomal subunit protein bS6 n=1 Tax=Actinobaculum suis TaxID=1657 RepID=A0A0K9ERF6_9ACTO|nr:30S ribosomal protein S6 [Actinobaculum suis]KMY22768.1 30S ribosomal protein S6 [Actinobaculum suis]MDY5152710.1 30S ribosomal protein S6 [Actinobaculum suis]OCA95065.1 30S ribosomal protein S6 [Actinobaculum suis]OCA95779.1 30S ribosomal protein S6 [Actinobaculum suis]SDE09340.1 small subunit ribosomal protein S6 [Actinobaculum suis]